MRLKSALVSVIPSYTPTYCTHARAHVAPPLLLLTSLGKQSSTSKSCPSHKLAHGLHRILLTLWCSKEFTTYTLQHIERQSTLRVDAGDSNITLLPIHANQRNSSASIRPIILVQLLMHQLSAKCTLKESKTGQRFVCFNYLTNQMTLGRPLAVAVVRSVAWLNAVYLGTSQSQITPPRVRTQLQKSEGIVSIEISDWWQIWCAYTSLKQKCSSLASSETGRKKANDLTATHKILVVAKSSAFGTLHLYPTANMSPIPQFVEN